MTSRENFKLESLQIEAEKVDEAKLSRPNSPKKQHLEQWMKKQDTEQLAWPDSTKVKKMKKSKKRGWPSEEGPLSPEQELDDHRNVEEGSNGFDSISEYEYKDTIHPLPNTSGALSKLFQPATAASSSDLFSDNDLKQSVVDMLDNGS